MITSILRTLVPSLWGSLVLWVLSMVPALEPVRADLLAYGDVLAVVVTGVVIAAWYALWRWLEPRLPDWLTRAVLGSVHPPVYPTAPVKQSPVKAAAAVPEVPWRTVTRPTPDTDTTGDARPTTE